MSTSSLSRRSILSGALGAGAAGALVLSGAGSASASTYLQIDLSRWRPGVGGGWYGNQWVPVASISRSSDYTYGSRRVTMIYAQATLNHLMGERLTLDGVEGPATRAAVLRFQRSDFGKRYRLAQDGVWGPACWSASNGGTPAPHHTFTYLAVRL